MFSLNDIRRRLAARRPTLLPTASRTHAAVALVLRDRPSGPEMLFIRRAMRQGDPWSGDIGFPGGKVEAGDRQPRRTAEREAREELDLDLSRAECLGRLDDLAGAHLPVVVSCFVYAAAETGPFTFSHEITAAFWVPLMELANRRRHVPTTVRFQGEILVRPAIRLPGEGDPILWGITYRLIGQLLAILGCDCPQAPNA